MTVLSRWFFFFNDTATTEIYTLSPHDALPIFPRAFRKHDAYLESDDYVVTWAIGHLVGLAAPEAYGEKLKKWRFADLPLRSEEHTSEIQSRQYLVCRLLLENKKKSTLAQLSSS